MKRVFRTSILIIILFAVITILTAKIERPFDGNNSYGFPVVFLTEYSLMVLDLDQVTPPSFNFLNLLLDLAPVIVLGIVTEQAIMTIAGRLRKK